MILYFFYCACVVFLLLDVVEAGACNVPLPACSPLVWFIKEGEGSLLLCVHHRMKMVHNHHNQDVSATAISKAAAQK